MKISPVPTRKEKADSFPGLEMKLTGQLHVPAHISQVSLDKIFGAIQK